MLLDVILKDLDFGKVGAPAYLEDVEVDLLLALSEYRADIGQGLDKLQLGEICRGLCTALADDMDAKNDGLPTQKSIRLRQAQCNKRFIVRNFNKYRGRLNMIEMTAPSNKVSPLSVQRAPSDEEDEEEEEEEYEPRGKSGKSGKRDHSPGYSPYSKGRRVTRNDDPLETDIDVGEDDEEG